MGFVHADRVKETTTTTGLGTYSLAGAAAGFRTFVAGVGDGNRCTYIAENGTDWEINEGVVTDAAPDTLSRARLLASSTGSAINWGAGTKNVFAVYAAADQNPKTKALTSAYTNNTTTGTEVTGLTVPLEPGTYKFEYFLFLRSAATGTGAKFGVAHDPDSVISNGFAVVERWIGTGSAASTGTIDDQNTGAAAEQIMEGSANRVTSNTAPNLDVMAGVAVINVNNLVVIEGVISVSAAGDLELWAASEVASSMITLGIGSSVEVLRTN